KQKTIWLGMALLSACLLFASSGLFADDDKAWTVNIRNAEIQAFIDKVADMTGKNFVVDPRVRARDVTVISREPLTGDEVYELFLSVLQVQGYAAVESGGEVCSGPSATRQ